MLGHDRTVKPSPFIIPFFISHQGCPHQCVFCNQHVITGKSQLVTAAMVDAEIHRCLGWPRDEKRPVQVAFYGGSFTGLNMGRQEELLGAVQPFLEKGTVQTIRLSTRPDYIDRQGAYFLRDKGVGIVELGIQSFDTKVLTRCRRGHRPEQVDEAFAHLRRAGISVGGQLMVGLPGESRVGVIDGARRLVALRPNMVRIYPTLVLKNSPLADLYNAGGYRPLKLYNAVALCCRLKSIFDGEQIPVVRMGLQSSESLEKDILAGPYHPAFGELVLGRLYFNRMRYYLSAVQRKRGNKMVRLLICPTDQSIFFGQKKCSFRRLTALRLLDGVEIVYIPSLKRQEIRHELVFS